MNPYYVAHKWLGMKGNRWIVRHYDSKLDPGSAFVLDRFSTQKAAMNGIKRFLRAGVQALAPYAECRDDDKWAELGERYRRMKHQLDQIEAEKVA